MIKRHDEQDEQKEAQLYRHPFALSLPFSSSFSLYLHVPFCLSKCGYCSFYSEPIDEIPFFFEASTDAWLEALIQEAKNIASHWRGRRPPLRTLYIGGGTPSLLSLPVWGRLIHLLDNTFDLSELEEATIEANPCSLTEEHLSIWRDSFVTRVSLGIQSLQNDELAWLGRQHDEATALLALDKTLAYGFDVSADLIFGIPHQTLRTWRDSLQRVLDSGVEHVSAYQLTLEPDTPLGKITPSLSDGYSFYRFAQWYLPRKGLEQYEIASFSRPSKECRHNLAYWRQENVLALGPSAWGYLTKEGLRYRNAPTLKEYITSMTTQSSLSERLGERSRGVEAAILALRTRWGIDVASFAARFGHELAEEVSAVLKEIPQRLVSFEKGHIHLTPAGMRVGNAIWIELLELDF
ncbi:MAG: radical SAM family heme chaperone HemW [Synergistaceae bacterium]|jgi:oxygen-independent coproporphyrinogen-3 oxidase|nr:radical SAM family heme chaperone HemW [Synergistaceae bacterium]